MNKNRTNSPNQQGFGLVEVLMAMIFLAISYSAIMYSQGESSRLLLNAESKNIAIGIVNQVTDSLELIGLSNVEDASYTVEQELYINGNKVNRPFHISFAVSNVLDDYGNVFKKNVELEVRWNLRGKDPGTATEGNRQIQTTAQLSNIN